MACGKDEYLISNSMFMLVIFKEKCTKTFISDLFDLFDV
jgi:hypothetical protein